MEPLYQTQVNCPCCETDFSSSRVRSSFKRALSADSDFCGYYREDANPDFYVVRVCPSCGFAFTENSLSYLNSKQKSAVLEDISSRWSPKDYGGARSLNQARDCYKLALISALAVGEKERVVAGLLHHIAWLYRYEGRIEEELQFLRHALHAYLRTYEGEGGELNNARLMFLIGELHRRLGEFNEAVRWFSRVVNDKSIMDASMIRASRDGWQQVRVQMQEGETGLEAMPH